MAVADKTTVWVQDEQTGDVIVRVKIGRLPRFGDPVKDKNGADVYSWADGVSVLSYVPGHGAAMCPVTSFTVEQDCPCVTVETDSGRSVVVSDNESLCVFDPVSGELRKTAPKDAIGLFVPAVKELPNFVPVKEGDRELGWWYGALISDGWCDHRTVGYAKLEQVKRDEFERIARKYICENFTRYDYYGKKGDGNKLGNSAKLHLNGADLASKVLKCVQAGNGRSAVRKYIPPVLLSGSREMLLGLLAGLLDGDGSMSVNTTLKKPRVHVSFSTSSPHLVTTMKELLRRLGCRYSVSTHAPRGFSNTAYSVHPCVTDFYRLLPELIFVGEREQAMRKAFLEMEPPQETRYDIVPISTDLASSLQRHVGRPKKAAAEHARIYGVWMDANKKGYMTRTAASKALAWANYPAFPGLLEFKARLDEDTIIWERVVKVTPAGRREVFDLAVPGTKVFAVNDGLIIYDTMNFHVPKSKEAVKEAFELLMPSKSLIQSSDMKSAMPRMISENAGGLYLASLPPDKKQKARTFLTWKDVEHAYNRGEIAMDDPVVVLQR